jgi:hypothetical protein
MPCAASDTPSFSSIVDVEPPNTITYSPIPKFTLKRPRPRSTIVRIFDKLQEEVESIWKYQYLQKKSCHWDCESW